MNRYMGWEAITGVGGGHGLGRSAEEKAEELGMKRKPERALPYLMEAMEGGNNLDACVQLAFLMPNLDMSVDVLRNTEVKGRENLLRILGSSCFDGGGDHVGHFWGILETRPYMRVLQAKQFANAANTIIEMLRLCPGDNLGQRDSLGTLILKANRPADALSFTMRTGLPPERGGCIFKAPSKTPLSAERAKQLSECCKADMAYTGALAAYRLWGDCELARQYLRIDNLTNMPWQMNGQEDAHDYLWLAQDLWMARDVWDWAAGDEKARGFALKMCSRGMWQARGQARGTIYCSQACQKADWPSHKPNCREHQQMKEFQRAVWLGKPLPKRDGGPPIPVVSAELTPNGIMSTFFE
ncbi:hypothetical protein OBBRIDRAFT_810581 [Obba rivulosa]|uniref:MYND-type domain-containing protein n=1 Tax=Obba rivulosa TaxID=1052685 RepID=A0A8E2J6C5_9APHY|nr:hypothetical protein OBBRIDRAFT_810581 [Obba rivulosa]